MSILDSFRDLIGLTNVKDDLERLNKYITNFNGNYEKELTLIYDNLTLIKSNDTDIKTQIDTLAVSIKEINDRVKLIQSGTEFENLLDSKLSNVNLIYTKRWIFKKENTVPINITDFIKNCNSLPKLSSLKTIYEDKITYVYDNYEEHQIPDFWQLNFETNKLRKADCEDVSFYRIGLARRIGEKNVFAAIGLYNGGGHMFTIYYRDGKTFILEATSNTYKELEIPNNDFKQKIGNYLIYYIFNENKTWQVNQKDVINFGELGIEIK